jgi:hypothetical protein
MLSSEKCARCGLGRLGPDRPIMYSCTCPGSFTPSIDESNEPIPPSIAATAKRIAAQAEKERQAKRGTKK